MKTVLTVALVLGALATWAPPVQAQSDDERAHAHFMAAQSYMDQGRYEDAAEQFEESYRLSQREELLRNAGARVRARREVRRGDRTARRLARG